MTADVLIVNPQMLFYDYEYEKLEQETPALCLGYLAAPLLNEGFNVKVVDMVVEGMKKEDLIRIIRRESPEIVGITSTTPSYFHSIKIAEAIKKDNPNIKVVLGGSHATARPVETLRETDAVDIVVYREGDYTFLELVKTIIDGQQTLEGIRGIFYRNKDGMIKTTRPRPFIKNLDDLPLPAIHLLPLKQYISHPISGGRGCPFRCIFCAAGHISGHTYRFRSAKNVIDELKYVYDKFGRRYFFFTDDTFTANKDRTMQICEEIRKEKLDIEWTCEARVNTVTRKMLKKMREAGCIGIQFGVESAVQKILNSIKKGITIEQVKQAVKDLIDVGIPNLTCSFMIGHPEDTVETVRKTFSFAQFLKFLSSERGGKTLVTTPFQVTVPLPGTYLYENASKLGIEILADSWAKYTTDNVLIRTKNLDEKTLRNLWSEAIIINTGLKIQGG